MEAGSHYLHSLNEQGVIDGSAFIMKCVEHTCVLIPCRGTFAPASCCQKQEDQCGFRKNMQIKLNHAVIKLKRFHCGL